MFTLEDLEVKIRWWCAVVKIITPEFFGP